MKKISVALFSLLIIAATSIPALSSGIAFRTERPVNPDAASHMSLNCSPAGMFFLTFADMEEEILESFLCDPVAYGNKDITVLEAPYYAYNAMDFANAMPAVYYYDMYHDDLRFCLYASNEWTDPGVCSGISSARKVRADLIGGIHLAWNYDDPGSDHCDLMYSTSPGGVWTHETVDRLSNTTMIEQFDIKYSSYDSLPHLAWFSPLDDCIYFATRTGEDAYDIEVAYPGVSACTWLELDFLQAVPIISFVDTSGSGDHVLRTTYKVGDWYDEDVISYDTITSVDMALAEDEIFTTFHWYYAAVIGHHFYCIRRTVDGWFQQYIAPFEGYSTNALIEADWDTTNDRIGVALNLTDEDKLVFVDGYEYTPTPSPNTPTPRPNTPTPTTAPGEPTNTPNEPTSTPVGGKGTVLIVMPDTHFTAGETCFCQVKYSMPSQEYGMPLFVLLDVWGSYFFWPSYTSDLNYELVDPGPVPITIDVIPEFIWPSGVSPASGIVWWGALTNSEMTELMCDPIATWTFGWS